MIRRPPRSTRVRSSAASDVYKRQVYMLKKFINLVMLVVCFFPLLPGNAAGLPDFTELVEKQAAAVVNISTTQQITQPNFSESDPFFELFKHFTPQMPREQESQSLGSGFIISGDGY